MKEKQISCLEKNGGETISIPKISKDTKISIQYRIKGLNFSPSFV